MARPDAMGASGFRGPAIVEGPATLTVRSGSVNVLGAEVGEGGTVTVPAGRALPVIIDGDVHVTPPGAAVVPIADSFFEALEQAASAVRGKSRVAVLGPTDSGKSTLAFYLINVGVADGLLSTDVGQNEVYCPAFEASAAVVRRPAIPGLHGPLRVLGSCFVGDFTPRGLVGAYVGCARSLAAGLGSYVADTDGWVEGEGLNAKVDLVRALRPDVVVAVALGGDAVRRLQEATGVDVVPLPRLVGREKSRSERRLHRERLISACMSGARRRVLRDVPVVALGRGGPSQGSLAAASYGGNDFFSVVERIDEARGYVTLITKYEGPVSEVKVGRARIDLKSYAGLIAG